MKELFEIVNYVNGLSEDDQQIIGCCLNNEHLAKTSLLLWAVKAGSWSEDRHKVLE